MQKIRSGLLLHSYVLAFFLSLASSSIILQNSSSLLPPPSDEATSNTTSVVNLSRSQVPFEWPISNSDTKLLVLYYYRNMQANNIYSSIIEAFYELYQAAIYDHDDLPVQAGNYQYQSHGVFIDISRYADPGTPKLYYSTVARTLLGIERMFHTYTHMCGLSMIVFERGKKVARASLKPLGTSDDA